MFQIVKYQIINCLYWIYEKEPRLLYTDTVNILDCILYYLQSYTNNQYFPGIKLSDVFYLDENDKLCINRVFKDIIKTILIEEGILNTFGYIDFGYSKTQFPNDEYDLWKHEHLEILRTITTERLISNKTKEKIQEILKTEKTRKLLAMKNSNQLNDK